MTARTGYGWNLEYKKVVKKVPKPEKTDRLVSVSIFAVKLQDNFT